MANIVRIMPSLFYQPAATHPVKPCLSLMAHHRDGHEFGNDQFACTHQIGPRHLVQIYAEHIWIKVHLRPSLILLILIHKPNKPNIKIVQTLNS